MMRTLLKKLSVVCVALVCALPLLSCSVAPEVMTKLETPAREGRESLNKQDCMALREAVTVEFGAEMGKCDRDDGDIIMIPYDPGRACNNGSNPKMGIVKWIIARMDYMTKSIVAAAYQRFANSLSMTIRAMLTLFLTIYVTMILMGMARATPFGVTLNLAKMLMIYALAGSPLAWTTFNDLVVRTFESAVKNGVYVMSNVYSDGSDPFLTGITEASGEDGTVVGSPSAPPRLFSIVDEHLSLMYSAKFLKLAASGLVMGGTGIMYSVALTVILVGYTHTIVRVFFWYLTALMIRMFLYSVGPLFICFALFQITAPIFSGWLSMLLSMTLQPIFTFTFVGMFHGIISGFRSKLVEGQQYICYREWWQLPGGELKFHWWQFGDGTPGAPSGFGQNPNPDLGWWTVVVMAVVTLLMKHMVEWAASASSGFMQTFAAASKIPIFGFDGQTPGAGAVEKVIGESSKVEGVSPSGNSPKAAGGKGGRARGL